MNKNSSSIPITVNSKGVVIEDILSNKVTKLEYMTKFSNKNKCQLYNKKTFMDKKKTFISCLL